MSPTPTAASGRAASAPRTGRERLRSLLAEHAASRDGVLLGEAVGVGGLSAGLDGQLVRTPLSEASAVGAAVGMALAGKRAVVELIDPAGVARASEALAEAAALADRGAGGFAPTVVLIAPLRDDSVLPALPNGVRGYVAGVADDLAPMFAASLSGRRPAVLFVPDTVLDARLTGETQGDVARPQVLRPGEGLTVLAEGAGVALALASTADVEVVDLRGCRDAGVVAPFVARTGRVVICGHTDAASLFAPLLAAFWRLESPPVAVLASAGGEALQAAVSESLSV